MTCKIQIIGLDLKLGDIIKISTKYDMKRFEVVRIRESALNQEIYDLTEVEYL